MALSSSSRQVLELLSLRTRRGIAQPRYRSGFNCELVTHLVLELRSSPPALLQRATPL
ncbi:hypothetical protein N665_0037s0009 [Sinapis alba]|nr:hypothetical protein N665_0037s0009 [Sinapis alba]